MSGRDTPRHVTVKRKCCKSKTRCKRCPILFKKLEQQGWAEKAPQGTRREYLLDPDTPKGVIKAIRKR